MKLFFTDSDFQSQGVSRPDIPFLCDAEMELVQAPNEFLRHIAIVKGRTRAPNTWRTYGNDLYEYFAFLEANEYAWDSVNQQHLAAWRDAMLERGCSRSTVNQRLRCIHRFYEWAAQHGRTHALPFDFEDISVPKPAGLLAHVDASGGRFSANELTVPTHKPVPPFLHMGQAIRFLDAMTPHSLKLMGYLALLTGMRRQEIVGLDYRVVPNPAGRDTGKQIPMVLDPALTPTKGSKQRFVMVPYDLAVALWEYFNTIWPKLNAIYESKHGVESTRLFLSAYGEELSVRYLNNQFSRVSTKTKIKCHPHMLRHTYGTYELLRISEKEGRSKALLWVRDRMGHSSISNTEIYVHTADLVQNDDIDGYQLEILHALKNGAQQTQG